MKEIFLTDKTLAPRIRFLQILLHSLSNDGYELKKSNNELVQKFEFGKRSIRASFISTFGSIHDVQFFMSITFSELEKIFKKAVPNFGWPNWTIHYNLGCIDQYLCDEDTVEYSDYTLNAAADSFFEKIKPEYDRIISMFDSPEKLEAQINDEPTNNFEYSGRYDKRVINGLILRKYFKKDSSYPELKRQYLSKHTEHIFYKTEDVEMAINYIENNEHHLYYSS